MHIYDISLTISPSLLVWPGDPPVVLSRPAQIAAGDIYTLTRLDMSAHAGTHVDAPAHFLAAGAGVESLDLNALIGPAFVVDATALDEISAAALESLPIPRDAVRLLFRTRNSALWLRKEQGFVEDFVAIAEDGAQWLVARGVRLVGVDYLSVAPFHDSIPTHLTLLRAGVIPLEGLDLSAVEPGPCQLVCLPLKIAGSDGAPARAVLIR